MRSLQCLLLMLLWAAGGLRPASAQTTSTATVATVAATTPATTATVVAWSKAAGENREFEKILPDFDPALTPVALADVAGTRTVTREGKGWLEVIGAGPSARRVLHLKGTPHEMGYQHGKLLAPEVRVMSSTILQTVGMVESLHSGKPFVKTLQEIFDREKTFIPAEYIEEATGLAEGAGLSPEAMILCNIFPERFHCSGFALWGKATADGKLYHGRILDYMTEIGLQSVATVIVCEPDGKIPWVNVGFAGFIGSVTGMNARQISIGEMGGRGEGQWDGMPMSYLVRHALENCATLDEAVKMFNDTKRTCEYYYVVSDGKIPGARGLCCTPERCEVVGPGEWNARLAHPVADAVLLSAGDRYQRLVMRTEANYGKFAAPEALALMRRPVAMKSCLHAVLFCPTDGRFWVANAATAAANASPDKQPASEQPFAAYNLSELLKSTPGIEDAGQATAAK